MNHPRSFLRILFVLTVFGIISLLAMIGGPAWERIRNVDIVHLIGTGMCFGAAIISLVVYMLGRR